MNGKMESESPMVGIAVIVAIVNLVYAEISLLVVMHKCRVFHTMAVTLIIWLHLIQVYGFNNAMIMVDVRVTSNTNASRI